MRTFRHTSLIIAVILLSATSLRAQSARDIAGHWEGIIEGPMEQKFEVDFVKSASGEFTGTIGIPAENVRGLPIIKATVDGNAVYFYAREDQPNNGYVSEDGKSITGSASVETFSIPLNMTRTGDARIEPFAKSAAVAKELEGDWSATVGGMRLVLRLANQPDGSSSGRLINLDQGKLQIPVSSITQSSSNLTLDLKAIGGSYSGTLNADATEIIGSYSERGRSTPVTFKHSSKWARPSGRARDQ